MGQAGMQGRDGQQQRRVDSGGCVSGSSRAQVERGRAPGRKHQEPRCVARVSLCNLFTVSIMSLCWGLNLSLR